MRYKFLIFISLSLVIRNDEQGYEVNKFHISYVICYGFEDQYLILNEQCLKTSRTFPVFHGVKRLSTILGK